MSELRNQLEQARQTYAAARYPGDLATDVLPAPRRDALRWIGAAVALSGVAAAIVVSWAVLRGRGQTGADEPVRISAPIASAVSDQSPFAFTLEIPSMPPMPAVPAGLSFTVPAMPEIPSFDAVRNQMIEESNSTTQEAV